MQIIRQTTGYRPRSFIPSFIPQPAQQWLDSERLPSGDDFATDAEPLQWRVLRTPREQSSIKELRKLAAFGVEQDLRLGLAPMEEERDRVGLVTAVCSGSRVLATLRFVPTGYGLTGAERLFEQQAFDTEILGEGSWEIGRVIMAPEDRHPDILLRCLTVALHGLLKLEDVRRFHATTTLAMARLWRRFGMRTEFTRPGQSGVRYALVHGPVEAAAAAMGVTLGHTLARM
jgi:hypothetical protein